MVGACWRLDQLRAVPKRCSAACSQLAYFSKNPETTKSSLPGWRAALSVVVVWELGITRVVLVISRTRVIRRFAGRGERVTCALWQKLSAASLGSFRICLQARTPFKAGPNPIRTTPNTTRVIIPKTSKKSKSGSPGMACRSQRRCGTPTSVRSLLFVSKRRRTTWSMQGLLFCPCGPVDPRCSEWIDPLYLIHATVATVGCRMNLYGAVR